MVVISQVVSESGADSKVNIDIGMAAQVRGASTLGSSSIRVSNGATGGFAGLPALNLAAIVPSGCGTGVASAAAMIAEDSGSGEVSTGCAAGSGVDAAITDAVDAVIASNISAVAANINDIVQANGAATAIFTFEQNLGSSALTGTRRLVWSAVIDPSGRAIYGKSKIISMKKFFVYVAYTPRAVAAGLPQEWAYPNAGTLTWTLVDSKMQSLQSPVSYNTGGYFDEPEGDVGSEVQLRCLVNKVVAGCSSPYPDAASLISQTGASGAFVDYIHAVAPVYNTVESPPGSGDIISIAQLILKVPDRSVSTAFDPTCLIKKYTYSNSGTYQFNLNHAMTRYYVDPSLPNYTAVAQMATTVVSPIKGYALSLEVSEAQLPALTNLYIDPFLQEGPLVSVGSLPAGSSLASVDYLPPPACTPVLPPVPTVPTGP